MTRRGRVKTLEENLRPWSVWLPLWPVSSATDGSVKVRSQVEVFFVAVFPLWGAAGESQWTGRQGWGLFEIYFGQAIPWPMIVFIALSWRMPSRRGLTFSFLSVWKPNVVLTEEQWFWVAFGQLWMKMGLWWLLYGRLSDRHSLRWVWLHETRALGQLVKVAVRAFWFFPLSLEEGALCISWW